MKASFDTCKHDWIYRWDGTSWCCLCRATVTDKQQFATANGWQTSSQQWHSQYNEAYRAMQFWRVLAGTALCALALAMAVMS